MLTWKSSKKLYSESELESTIIEVWDFLVVRQSLMNLIYSLFQVPSSLIYQMQKSRIKFSKEHLDYIREIVANPSHRVYHNPLYRFTARNEREQKQDNLFNAAMTERHYEWSSKVIGLDSVIIPQRVKNLIKPRIKVKDPSSSAFKSLEDRVRRNLHSIDMKVSENEKQALAQRRLRNQKESRIEATPQKSGSPHLDFQDDRSATGQTPSKQRPQHKSNSQDALTATPSSRRAALSALEKQFFDDRISHAQLIKSLKKTKDNPIMHQIELNRLETRHLLSRNVTKSVQPSQPTIQLLNTKEVLPQIKEKAHLKVNGVIYFRNRNGHTKNSSLPNLWQNKASEGISTSASCSDFSKAINIQKHKVRNVVRFPSRGPRYLMSLDPDYLKDLNSTVNLTLQDMKQKKRFPRVQNRQLKNVTEESQSVFSPQHVTSKPLAMKALYQLSTVQRKERQMLTRDELLKKNEELRDDLRKEAMQEKIDAWAQEKKDLAQMMEKYGGGERRFETLQEVKEQIIEDLSKFLKIHKIHWKDFFHPGSLARQLQFIKFIQKDQEYKRFVETHSKTLWELILQMVEMVTEGTQEQSPDRLLDTCTIPSGRLDISPEAEYQFEKLERKFQQLSERYKERGQW